LGAKWAEPQYAFLQLAIEREELRLRVVTAEFVPRDGGCDLHGEGESMRQTSNERMRSRHVSANRNMTPPAGAAIGVEESGVHIGQIDGRQITRAKSGRRVW